MSNLLWPGDHRAGDLFTDSAFLDAMLRVEAAWSTGLVAVGVAPPGAEVSVEVLRDLIGDNAVDEIAIAAEAGGNPVIPMVRNLRSRLGDGPAATWLHRGMTSQDVVDTALMYCAADTFAQLREEVDRQISALSGLAVTHRKTSMVARTLTQSAVPMTFGLKAAQWLRGALDARDDLGRSEFPAQFGGAAGTSAAIVELAGPDVGAAVAIEAAVHAAARLGLRPSSPWHSVRTAITRGADAALGCTDAWGHIANDVLTLSRPEIGEVTEGEGGASSTMPHKANPVLSVLIRRTALAAPPLGATLHLAAADAADERSPGAWHVEWDTLRILLRRTAIAAQQATRLVTGLRIHADRMSANLAATGAAITSEQSTMAEVAGHEPADEYLGAAQLFIDAQLDRAVVRKEDR
ncbi:lyase family protein [Gordonia sp. CPCC 206044]|uniref:lyase family protein n=1 Tax=Gordonia sp. CPCC 206044 TaxID=3140793 RepID=UPI003AF3F8E7